MIAVRMKSVYPGIFVIIAMMLAIAANVQARSFESLIMPGKLIEGHAKYEDECKQCHRPFSKQSQNVLCLDCHEKVAEDVDGKKGFHGLNRLGETECSSCHADHKGRDAKVMQFSTDTFDHDLTDYPLKGMHGGVGCNACHKDGDKYREAPGKCFDCHEGDDLHKGNLGKKCSDCHSVKGWREEQQFDHDETDFRLLGEHIDVQCDSCHAGQRYENTPMKCSSCHRLNDAHAGNYGSDCDDCHRESGWKKIRFDHAKTDFPLTGNHRDVKCETCHGGDVMADDLGTDCVSCHKSDDDHKGQYGKECDACHKTSGWEKVKFDHDRETDFPLRGKHAEQNCGACHRGELGNETLGSKCIDCHKANDVHASEQGETCDQCHSEKGWATKVRFEHDMTSFPLIGMHSVAPCEECHLSAVYSETLAECDACHADDDVHEKKLGPACEACHNPNAWSLWEFDHNNRTDFKLDGSHEGIDCHACHKRPVKKKIKQSGACGSCHKEDDVHDGRFGRFCVRCHNTESFDAVEIIR